MQEGNGWKGIYWWRIEKVTKFCYIFKIWSIKIEILKLRDQNWNPVFEGGEMKFTYGLSISWFIYCYVLNTLTKMKLLEFRLKILKWFYFNPSVVG